MKLRLTMRDVNGAPLGPPMAVDLPDEGITSASLRIQFDSEHGGKFHSQMTKFDTRPDPPPNLFTLQVERV